jgi:hypothetical protein
MNIDPKFRNTDSFNSFRKWWSERISSNRGNKPPMPDFFEVWNARQKEIDQLKEENENLKSKIKGS